MSTIIQPVAATGAASPKVLNHKFTGAVVTGVTIPPNAGKSIIGTVATANTLVTMINETGAGVVKFLALIAAAANNQQLRLKITIDGVVVYDITQSGLSAINDGFIGIGGLISATQFEFDQVNYSSQFLVEATSSTVVASGLNVIATYQKN